MAEGVGAGAGSGGSGAGAPPVPQPELVDRYLSAGMLPKREQWRRRIHGVRADFGRHTADTGSSEVQVAALTERIALLNDHRKTHRHDYASERGIQRCLAQRRRLLRYLRRTNFGLYAETIQQLGLKDNYR